MTASVTAPATTPGPRTPTASSLSAARRARELADLLEPSAPEVDVLVVGLGITGAGVALDAAARGLSVAAIDAHDLAFGTSRWSSKLVHGGLRYLAKGQVDVAWESAVERDRLMRTIAPHLVRPLPMVMPLTPMTSAGVSGLMRAGFLAGDALRLAARTPREVLPGPRRIGATEARRLAPAVRTAGLRGAHLSWDGQLEDDARLVLAVARTAAAHGTRVLTRVRALGVDGGGADVCDETTGATGRIRARMVVNATGVWADTLVPGIELRPSRGTHLVVRSAALADLRVAITAPIPGETNRVVLALPQPDGNVYVGLTDEPVEGAVPDVPVPSEAEIGFLLDVLGGVLQTPLRRTGVVGAYAGLRPLLAAGGRTADISRRHAVLTSPEGVVTIIGGKLTTYRRMAQDAVDAALAHAGRSAAPCSTAALPLVGAGPVAGLDPALPRPVAERLVRRFGAEAPAVAALAAELGPGALDPVAEGLAVTPAELHWAVRHEGALDVEDLLARRTRLDLVAADRAAALPAAEAALSGLG